MTAAQLIARAEAALRTDQPNLATLYMRRAAEYLDAERAIIKQDYRKARTKINPMASIGFAMQDASEALQVLTEALKQSVAHSLSQADFTLAGPSRGGTA